MLKKKLLAMAIAVACGGMSLGAYAQATNATQSDTLTSPTPQLIEWDPNSYWLMPAGVQPGQPFDFGFVVDPQTNVLGNLFIEGFYSSTVKVTIAEAGVDPIVLTGVAPGSGKGLPIVLRDRKLATYAGRDVTIKIEAENDPSQWSNRTYHAFQGLTGSGMLKLLAPAQAVAPGKPFTVTAQFGDKGQGDLPVYNPLLGPRQVTLYATVQDGPTIQVAGPKLTDSRGRVSFTVDSLAALQTGALVAVGVPVLPKNYSLPKDTPAHEVASAPLLSLPLYKMPAFKLRAKASSPYAPSTLTLDAGPAAAGDEQMALGRKYTYTWTCPQQLTCTPTRTGGVTVPVEQSGSYAFTVAVTDDTGQGKTFTETLEVKPVPPLALNLSAKFVGKVEREPASYRLTSQLVGGYKDRPVSYVLKLDDKVLYDGPRMPTMVGNLVAGQHTIAVMVSTLKGAQVTGTQSVTVARNAVPTCQLTVSPAVVDRFTKKQVSRVSGACSDADGVIKGTAWFVDNQPVRAAGNAISVTDQGTGQSQVVRIEATDDSGGVGSAQAEVGFAPVAAN